MCVLQVSVIRVRVPATCGSTEVRTDLPVRGKTAPRHPSIHTSIHTAKRTGIDIEMPKKKNTNKVNFNAPPTRHCPWQNSGYYNAAMGGCLQQRVAPV